jgi:predicted nucleic acid-binding protein
MAMEYRRPRVFIDADVLIAGAASTTGASHLVLRLSELGLIDGIVSSQVVREAERNLQRKLPAALPAFRALVEAACHPVDDPTEAQIAVLRGQGDPKDIPILAAALRADCDWLLTFNTKDFRPASGQTRVAQPGAFIDSLRRMLEELAEQQ